jgi:hypothetical protein
MNTRAFERWLGNDELLDWPYGHGSSLIEDVLSTLECALAFP